MTPRISVLTLGFFALAAIPRSAWADVSLFPLFGDHAVIQAADHVPVWGRATPGESVTVTVGGDRAKGSAVAGADGKWTVILDLHGASGGPFDLVAEGPHNQVKSVDVLVGEVWLCSGQSNMEFTLKNAANGQQEVDTSANMMLRHFQVAKDAEPAPLDTVRGRWELSGPTTAGGFTAVGYYFAKQVQAVTHSPVGLIHSSWGGTPIEAWTSQEGFAASADPTLKAGAEKARGNYAAYQKFLADYKAWQVRYLREDHLHSATAAYTAPAKDGEAGWSPVNLPTLFAPAGLPDAGAVWLQRTVPIKPGDAGRPVSVYLGSLHGSAEVYWNGKKIGDSSSTSDAYHAGGTDVKSGDNVLAVRLFESDQGAGIVPGDAKFRADLPDGSMPLAGPWLAKAEFELPRLAAGQEPSPTRPTVPHNKQDVASFLYNGMIAPLEPCAIRGVLWYQGESNAGRAAQYREAFPLMISDWRARWGRGDFSFYWCQLANYQARQPKPGDANWAELRDAQTAALKLPNTGEAILIDLGEEADIHPKDKADVGLRLARIALAKDYGQQATVWSGPVLEDMKVEAGGKVRLTFTHADGGLVAKPIPETYKPSSLQPATKPNVRNSPGGQLEGFAVCGADHHWQWATTADIEGGDAVVVTCKEVPEPVAVRYAWADNPLCNLANGAGLPAGPFRTDDFPLSTAKGKY